MSNQKFNSWAFQLWAEDNPQKAQDSAFTPEEIWRRMDEETHLNYISKVACTCVTQGILCQHCVDKRMKKDSRKSDASNPKDGIGAKKVGVNFLSGKVIMDLAKAFGGISSIPQQPLFEMALAFVEGSYKYGAHNYRASGVRVSIYYAAFNRHMTQWFTKESDIDVDSGIHHTAKAMACIAIIMDSRDMGNGTDDRPLRLPMQYDLDEVGIPSASALHNRAKAAMILWWEGGSDDLLLEALRLVVILRKAILIGHLNDDRIKQPFDIDAMNVLAKEIAGRYPNPEPAYTELGWRDKLTEAEMALADELDKIDQKKEKSRLKNEEAKIMLYRIMGKGDENLRRMRDAARRLSLYPTTCGGVKEVYDVVIHDEGYALTKDGEEEVVGDIDTIREALLKLNGKDIPNNRAKGGPVPKTVPGSVPGELPTMAEDLEYYKGKEDMFNTLKKLAQRVSMASRKKCVGAEAPLSYSICHKGGDYYCLVDGGKVVQMSGVYNQLTSFLEKLDYDLCGDVYDG